MEQSAPVADRLSRDFREELEKNFDDFLQLNVNIVDNREEAKRFISKLGQRLIVLYKRLCYYRVLDVFDTVPESPLNTATAVGDIEIMRSLIQFGFDPHARDQVVFATGCRDVYPIIWAAEKGTLESVQYLVEEQGCDINVCDGYFRDTPLHKATKMCRFEIVKYLVEKGADVNAENFIQHPPILNALLYPDICRFLLDRGADLRIMDKTDRPFLHYAILICQDLNLIQSFLDAGANITKTSQIDEMSPFAQAACYRKLDIMKVLYSNGADPETVDKYGFHPIHFAVGHLSTDILHYLVVELNVSMDKKTALGKTAFQLSLEDMKVDHVNLFLDAGYMPTEDEVSVVDNFTHQLTDEIADMAEHVRSVIKNPRSLEDLCLFKLRKLLGRSVQTDAERLTLPTLLKDRIKLRHVHPTFKTESLPVLEPEQN